VVGKARGRRPLKKSYIFLTGEPNRDSARVVLSPEMHGKKEKKETAHREWQKQKG
jgi:hypothetical protein